MNWSELSARLVSVSLMYCDTDIAPLESLPSVLYWVVSLPSKYNYSHSILDCRRLFHTSSQTLLPSKKSKQNGEK